LSWEFRDRAGVGETHFGNNRGALTAAGNGAPPTWIAARLSERDLVVDGADDVAVQTAGGLGRNGVDELDVVESDTVAAEVEANVVITGFEIPGHGVNGGTVLVRAIERVEGRGIIYRNGLMFVDGWGNELNELTGAELDEIGAGSVPCAARAAGDADGGSAARVLVIAGDESSGEGCLFGFKNAGAAGGWRRFGRDGAVASRDADVVDLVLHAPPSVDR